MAANASGATSGEDARREQATVSGRGHLEMGAGARGVAGRVEEEGREMKG